MMLTDQELQSLRNLGNQCEEAASEIYSLRAALTQKREDLAMAVYFAMRDAAEAKGNAGFSWDGFNITGDVQSVREVRRLVEFHAARRVEAP